MIECRGLPPCRWSGVKEWKKIVNFSLSFLSLFCSLTFLTFTWKSNVTTANGNVEEVGQSNIIGRLDSALFSHVVAVTSFSNWFEMRLCPIEIALPYMKKEKYRMITTTTTTCWLLKSAGLVCVCVCVECVRKRRREGQQVKGRSHVTWSFLFLPEQQVSLVDVFYGILVVVLFGTLHFPPRIFLLPNGHSHDSTFSRLIGFYLPSWKLAGYFFSKL